MNLKGKNVLVTGGAGFIGSHLVKKLLDYECKVHVADNFSRGKKKFRMKNWDYRFIFIYSFSNCFI